MAPKAQVRQSQLRRQSIDPAVPDSEAPYATDRYVDASCPPFVAVGTLVYLSGAVVGGRVQVLPADPTNALAMPAFGMVVQKPATTQCLVQRQGHVSPAGQTFVQNKLYYVGLNALPTASKPVFPIQAQIVGVGFDTGILHLDPSLAVIGAGLGIEKRGRELIGVRNGVNRIFMTPDLFIHGEGDTIELFYNGWRMEQTTAFDSVRGDYFVSEGGGPGSGFDTVTVMTFAPIERSRFVGNYTAVG